MKKTKLPCPECGKKNLSYYFHTKMTLLSCMSRGCPSIGKYGWVTRRIDDPRWGEISKQLIEYDQRGIEDNQPILYKPILKKS